MQKDFSVEWDRCTSVLTRLAVKAPFQHPMWKEGRKEGRKEGKKEGRKERSTTSSKEEFA